MKIKLEKEIDVSDWDKLICEMYGKPYSFKQQGGCKESGRFHFKVPNICDESGMNDTIPEIVNHEEMGVKFSVWLERDAKQKLKNQEHDFELSMWWERNFYPDVQMIANDLCDKGLLDAGEYVIDIDCKLGVHYD